MRIDTQELELMLTAILNGTPKENSPVRMNPQRSKIWDKLKAECDAMPEGAVVDVGSEGTPHDLSNLYKGS